MKAKYALAGAALAASALMTTAAWAETIGFSQVGSEGDWRPAFSANMQESAKEYAAHPEEAKKLLQVGLAPADASLDPLELASWTMVSRAILNLGETTIRN